MIVDYHYGKEGLSIRGTRMYLGYSLAHKKYTLHFFAYYVQNLLHHSWGKVLLNLVCDQLGQILGTDLLVIDVVLE